MRGTPDYVFRDHPGLPINNRITRLKSAVGGTVSAGEFDALKSLIKPFMCTLYVHVFVSMANVKL